MAESAPKERRGPVGYAKAMANTGSPDLAHINRASVFAL